MQSDKETATDLLTERQVRLDLCLQLRLFEADVSSAIDCLKHEVPTPMTCHFLNDPRLARSMNELEEVTATFLAAIKSGEEVIQKGSELSRAFESVGVNFPAGKGLDYSLAFMGHFREDFVSYIFKDIIKHFQFLIVRCETLIRWHI